MRDDDLRRKLRSWDPAHDHERPDTDLLVRVRRRLEGDDEPAWMSRSARGHALHWLRRPGELLGLPGWAPAAGLAFATVAAAVLIWVAIAPTGPEPGRDRPVATADLPSPEMAGASPDIPSRATPPDPTDAASPPDATGMARAAIHDDLSGAGSERSPGPASPAPPAGRTTPSPSFASQAPLPDRLDPAGDPFPGSVPGPSIEMPDLVPAATAAPGVEPVHLVLTASNGVRVYWNQHPGS